MLCSAGGTCQRVCNSVVQVITTSTSLKGAAHASFVRFYLCVINVFISVKVKRRFAITYYVTCDLFVPGFSTTPMVIGDVTQSPVLIMASAAVRRCADVRSDAVLYRKARLLMRCGASPCIDGRQLVCALLRDEPPPSRHSWSTFQSCRSSGQTQHGTRSKSAAAVLCCTRFGAFNPTSTLLTCLAFCQMVRMMNAMFN